MDTRTSFRQAVQDAQAYNSDSVARRPAFISSVDRMTKKQRRDVRALPPATQPIRRGPVSEAARLMALAGADLLLYPTAIGWDPSDDDGEKQRQLNAWITIQRAHGIANGLPVLVANRTGFEQSPVDDSGIQFWGNSFVCGPQGEFLAQADNDNEQVLLADVDMQRSESVRRIWPYLRDRRVDAYGDLTKRYRD